MLRSLQSFFVLGVWLMATPAAAEEATAEPNSNDPQSAQAGTTRAAAEEPASATAEEPTSGDRQSAQAGTASAAGEAPMAKPAAQDQQTSSAPAAAPAAPEEKPVEEPGLGGWQMEIHGYFRAPFSMGFSSRPDPETRVVGSSPPTYTGSDQLQISYGPTRTVDANYYSFAYTRLQEQDWAQLFIHAKKKHVEAVIGWMGYWFQGAGFRNPDAEWVPGNAYLTLDTDVEVASLTPNIALTVGAWWPRFGYAEKYDTYTLGQFRQLGEQLRLTIPVNPDLTVTLVQGFGTNRDGNFLINSPPPYQGNIGLDLLHYENLEVRYKEYVDVGLHYNNEWTRDPYLWQDGTSPKAYGDARKAHLTVIGAEANLFAPYAGRLWISPSYLTVQNGWALDWAGTEVMHSIGGMGIAQNYMGFTNTGNSSTGTGKMVNLGFLYENTLSNVQGKEPAKEAPEVTVSAFGLMANASLDLPVGSAITQNEINQFKWGADVTVQALDWLAFMARYDQVNYDMDNPGFIFSAITIPRIIISSHFLSSESIYIQYSRYRYGDKMVLAGTWPWNTPIVVGTDQYQAGSYNNGLKPDADVIRVQATVDF
jgi:hypothetical protein